MGSIGRGWAALHPLDRAEGTRPRGGTVPRMVRLVGDLYQRAAEVVLLSEARWTKPTARSPHPEYWHRGVWEGTEQEVQRLLAALVTALQPDLALETGSAYGQTAETMGNALKANGHGRLITLELDSERSGITRRRCKGLPVEVVNADTMGYTPPGPIDFVFFDSEPTLRPDEFRRFRSWMTTSTIVAFHDSEFVPELRRGVESLVDEGLVRAIYLPTPKGLALCEVLNHASDGRG